MWILIVLTIVPGYPSLEIAPNIIPIATYKDEASCISSFDNYIKNHRYEYRINRATGEKYIARIDIVKDTSVENLIFCKKIKLHKKLVK